MTVGPVGLRQSGGSLATHALSGRFVNAKIEEAFLATYAQHFCLNFSILNGVALLVTVGTMLPRYARWDSLDTIDKIKTCTLGQLGLVSLIFVWTNAPFVRRRMTPVVLEVALVIVLFSQLVNVVCEPAALQALFPSWAGTEDAFIGNRSDVFFRMTNLALGVDTILTAVHLALPVRWFVLVWMNVLFAIAFTICAALMCGSEGLQQMILLGGLILAVSIGQRTMERKSRVLHSIIVDERVLRAHAEFNAEFNAREKWSGKEGDETSSKVASKATAETTSTGAVFNTAQGEGSLSSIISLGLSEHWLIDDGELEINVEEVLGVGGCAVVYGGRFCNSPVAVKAHLTERDRSKLRQDTAILNEIRILRQVRHPNIALFHGAHISPDDEVMIVLERIQGTPLDAFCGQLRTWRAASPHAAVQVTITLQVVNALIYLHMRRPSVVHADLKPSNVMVEKRDGGYFPKLLDFGLSRIVTRSAKLLGGTARYVAPEVVKLQMSYRPHSSCDVYSLGCLLFFVACGRVPLAAVAPGKLISLLRKGQAPPELAWAPGTRLLERQRPLIEMCTAYEPSERPTASEAYDLLKETAPCQAPSDAAPPARAAQSRERDEHPEVGPADDSADSADAARGLAGGDIMRL